MIAVDGVDAALLYGLLGGGHAQEGAQEAAALLGKLHLLHDRLRRLAGGEAKERAEQAAALLLGPLEAGIVGALADFLGALLFPIGAYFPGFTLTAFLMGLCYGLFLYREQKFWRVLVAVGVHQFVLSMLLNSLWLWIISTAADKGYWAMVLARVPQTLLLAAVQLAVIPALVRLLPRLRKAMP